MKGKVVNKILKIFTIIILFYSFGCTKDSESDRKRIVQSNDTCLTPLPPLGYYEWTYNQPNYYRQCPFDCIKILPPLGHQYGGPLQCVFGKVGVPPKATSLDIYFPSPKIRFIELKSDSSHADSSNVPIIKLDSSKVSVSDSLVSK